MFELAAFHSRWVVDVKFRVQERARAKRTAEILSDLVDDLKTIPRVSYSAQHLRELVSDAVAVAERRLDRMNLGIGV